MQGRRRLAMRFYCFALTVLLFSCSNPGLRLFCSLRPGLYCSALSALDGLFSTSVYTQSDLLGVEAIFADVPCQVCHNMRLALAGLW
jgi:hypothetical protein